MYQSRNHTIACLDREKLIGIDIQYNAPYALVTVVYAYGIRQVIEEVPIENAANFVEWLSKEIMNKPRCTILCYSHFLQAAANGR